MQLVDRTTLGKSMRAVASDREAAEMLGINVDRTIALTFFIGSALAGFAGVMSGLEFQTISATIGFLAGLKAFTAAVVGGIGSITGAIVGGIVIGMCEAFSLSYISDEVLRPDRVRDPDRHDAHPPDRDLRPASTAKGLMPQIGVDEWVAQSGERRDEGTGLRRVLHELDTRVAWWQRLALAALVGVAFGLTTNNVNLLTVGPMGSNGRGRKIRPCSAGAPMSARPFGLRMASMSTQAPGANSFA